MHAAALLALLATGPADDWRPVEAPPPTAWARAGARPWRLCDDVGRQAFALRVGGGTRGSGTDAIWTQRAEQCPHAPNVLILAAQGEIIEASRLAVAPEREGSIDEIIEQHGKRVRKAVRWIDTAIAEAKRRGDVEPLEARYFRAYALVGLGRYDEARRDLALAIERGDVERWRGDRMGALVELLRGDIDSALVLAHRGVVDAPAEDRLISRYIWALVLDRVGAPAASRAELEALRREAGGTTARQVVQSVLPVHERLYLRALDHQANRETSSAVRLWDAYLLRSEPAEPDRELARRHKAELSPPPAPVGGPGA